MALGSGKSLLILCTLCSAFVNGPFLALTEFRSHRLSFISPSTRSTSTSSPSPFPSPNLLTLLLTPPTIFVTNAPSFLFCLTHSSKRLLSTPAPAPLDNTAIQAEVRKNLVGDGITGISINVDNGVVTLTGKVNSTSDRDKAYNDAAKVNGVTRVINRISVGS